MPNLSSTSELISRAERLNGGERFFSRFPSAWKDVKNQVLKLETRQEYQEPGNLSWEALRSGGLERALALLPDARQVDVPLYEALQERGVEFVRCRPVLLPPSEYLQWELGCYEFNARHGERIHFLDLSANRSIFEDYAHHDFMVFDKSLAFIHDYNDIGLICGGWKVHDALAIQELHNLFISIWERSVDFKEFLRKHAPEWAV